MGRIQSNIGLTSGIDIAKTVDQLMTVASKPVDLLSTRVKGLQAQQIAITELTALVVGIQLQSDRIGVASSISTTTATSAKSDVVTAAISGKAVPGNYSVQVLQTAQTATASSAPISSTSELLQAGEFVVRTGGFVDSSMDLDDVRGGAGVTRGLIRITDRSGTSREVDLRFAATMEDVVKAINNSGLKVSAKTVGDRLSLSDLSGQTTSNLIVEEVGGGRTAADLGLGGVNVSSNSATGDDLSFLGASTRLSTLRDQRGLTMRFGNEMSVNLKDGTSLTIDLDGANPPRTVGQLLAKVNAVNSDKLEMRIREDGDGFDLVDKTSGSSAFSATGRLADELGLSNKTDVDGAIAGSRVQNTLSGPLLSTLNGGKGIGTAGSISITNRVGVTTQVDLSGSEGLRDVMDKINNSNSGVTASLNRSRTGIVLQDITGGSANNLVIANADSNETATKLGIAADIAKSSVDSQSLKMQYVGEATELSRLNQGRGVRLGSFTITNAAGGQKSVTVTPNTKTVGDLLELVNANTIGVQARLNDEGDGILIVDTSTGSGSLTISENQSGNSAKDLGILGTGVSKTEPNRREINGSQTFRLQVGASDTVSDVVKKINDAGGPVTASLLTSGPTTVRVLLTSRATGEAGRMVADGDAIGLNINASGAARDALISVGGAADTGGTLIRSSTNTINNAIEGVSLTLKGTSTSPVDISVTQNNSTLERNLQLFVDQFNKVRDKIDKETEFNTETGTTGMLIGSSEVLRAEQTLTRLITQRTFGSGRVQSLEQLGVSLNDKGKLEFDKEKLSKAIAANPEDVTSFLTKENTGFGARAKKALDAIVGINNSTLVLRNQSLQRQIESTNKRIETQNARLGRERERLLNQFYKLEETLSKIRNNSNAMTDINSVLARFQDL